MSAANAVKSAGDLIFDQLNVAERALYAEHTARIRGRNAAFYAEDASYYATIGDAHTAAELRRAVTVLQLYAQLLASLVDGSSVSTASANIQALMAEVSALSQSSSIKLASQALGPVYQHFLTVAARQEGRELVAAGQPMVAAIIAALKESATPIFERLSSYDPTPKARDAWRVELSNFIVLLDRLQEGLDLLAAAYARPQSGSLARAAQLSGEIEADVRAIRNARIKARMSAERGSP